MRKYDSSTLEDDINVYNGDDVDKKETKFASEEFIDYVSSEEKSIIDNLSEDVQSAEVLTQEEEIDANGSVQEPLEDWIYAFKDIPSTNSLKLEEFGQIYIYNRVLDPDGVPTNKFNGFYKNTYETTGWIDLPGVLSNRYVATSLDKFINSVLKQRFQLTQIPITNKEPWKTAWLGVSNLTIDYLEIPDMAIHVFQNITERDVTITNIISKLGFSVTNTYDGSNKLKVTPIVRTTGYNGVGPMTSFVDYLSFCNFTHDISHTSDATGFNADLTTIQENVSDHLVVLKQYTDVDSVVDNISKSFKKPGREKFKLVYNSTQSENLFYVLIAASIALGKYYSIAEHLHIRSKIRKLFERIF